MFEAEVLIATGTDYYAHSPWFMRKADNALFEVEVEVAGRMFTPGRTAPLARLSRALQTWA